jgi:type II secretory pathway pseudopilin PulG
VVTTVNSGFRIRNSELRASSTFNPDPRVGRAASQNSKFKIENSTEGGYTLVVVVMIVAIMAIMMAVAVQEVSFQMQREREAELIFRGQQYVEGIRLYRQKYGRYPVRMKELWEANPKVLRQKWIDPITGSEDWGLVFLGQEGQQVNVSGGPVSPGQQSPAATPTRTPVFGDRGLGGEGEKVGPIIGVHSKSTKTSIKIYEGRTAYNEWKFVLSQQGEDSGGGAGRGGSGSPWGSPSEPLPTPPRPGPTGTPNY